MTINYSKISNPRYADKNNSSILVECYFDHLVGGPVTFCAMSSDTEEHGREIYADCMAGKYGKIADYAAPVPQPPSLSDRLSAVEKILQDNKMM